MSNAESTLPSPVPVYVRGRGCAHACRYINRRHSCRIYRYQTCTDSAAAVWILNVFPCWRIGNEVLMTVPAHRRGGGREGWGGGGQWRCGWAVDAWRIALRLTGDLVKERGCKRRSLSLFAGGQRGQQKVLNWEQTCIEQDRPPTFLPHRWSPAVLLQLTGFYFCVYNYLFSCRHWDKSPAQSQ